MEFGKLVFSRSLGYLVVESSTNSVLTWIFNSLSYRQYLLHDTKQKVIASQGYSFLAQNQRNACSSVVTCTKIFHSLSNESWHLLSLCFSFHLCYLPELDRAESPDVTTNAITHNVNTLVWFLVFSKSNALGQEEIFILKWNLDSCVFIFYYLLCLWFSKKD